jgi:hypothetical protein
MFIIAIMMLYYVVIYGHCFGYDLVLIPIYFPYEAVVLFGFSRCDVVHYLFIFAFLYGERSRSPLVSTFDVAVDILFGLF